MWYTSCWDKPRRICAGIPRGSVFFRSSPVVCIASPPPPPPPEIFACKRLNFAPVTMGSLTLLLTVLDPMGLAGLLQKVQSLISGPLRKLQSAMASLQELEGSHAPESVIPKCPSTAFDLLTLNVEQTMKTKVVALCQMVQWSGYPPVVLLQEVGVLPSHFVLHCLYWQTYTAVSSSSAGVAVLVWHDSQLHIGDFTHHPEGRAIVLKVTYRGILIQIVNVYMSAKGTSKEYCPLLKWLRAHVAPGSCMVLMGVDF